MSKDTFYAEQAFKNFFQHEIGDLIVQKCLLEAVKAEMELNEPLQKYERVGVHQGMVVVERLLQQCHGGIQGMYVVRRWDTKDKTEVMQRFVEEEVVAWREMVEATSMGRTPAKPE